MNKILYVGMDVHKSVTVIVVINEQGQIVFIVKVQTKVEALRDFIRGLSGTVHVVFEEGTQSNLLHELFKPLVTSVTVCNKRGVAKANKNDDKDAENLARALRNGEIKSVYKGDEWQQNLKEFDRAYDNLVQGSTRIRNRVKALYSKRAIDCPGQSVFRSDLREDWLAKLPCESMKFRAGLLLQELDIVSQLRKKAKQRLIKEAKRHPDYNLLLKMPGFGPVRTAQLIAIVGNPNRFRTKRQFWPYCGFAVVTYSSADYKYKNGSIVKEQKKQSTRGLNRNHNPQLKQIFKGAALTALRYEVIKNYYQHLIDNGTRKELARISVARKLASIALTIWQRAEEFDLNKAFAKS